VKRRGDVSNQFIEQLADARLADMGEGSLLKLSRRPADFLRRLCWFICPAARRNSPA
jgi:hypothetical protein